jgi:cell division septation protein DedD
MASSTQVRERSSIRRRRPHSLVLGSGALLAAALVATGGSVALAAGVPGAPGYLGAAAPFAVLAGSTATNTGAPTHVWGDVGVSPGTAAVGFQSSQVGGSVHAADSAAGNAQNALTDAYGAAAGATPSDSVNHATVGNQTFLPGVYKATSTMDLTGTVTLDGRNDPNATWVFQAGTALTTASSSRVLVINGNPCNVYWQVGSSATLGSSTRFVGTVLADISISAVTSATIDGRLLARSGAVTLDSNQITQPSCSLTDRTGATITTPTPGSTSTPAPSRSTPATPKPTTKPTPAPKPTASGTPALSGGSTGGQSGDSGTSGRLATTGSEVGTPLAFAGGLLGLGLLLVTGPALVRARRRRSAAGA